MSPVPGQTPTPGDDQRVFLTYQRTGGFIGVKEGLVIYTDGQSRATSMGGSCTFTVSVQTRDRLRRLLEQANFLGLKEDYPPKGGADFFFHRITYRAHTVSAVDPTMPQELWPVITILGRMIEKCADVED